MTKLTVSALVLAIAAGVVIAEPQPGNKPADKPADKPAGQQPKKIEPAKTEPGKESEPKKEEKSDGTLKVGDKAPEIKVDSWVKGNEVKKFEAGKVYIVEFWATWCPPCVKSIPHLTKLQAEHPELTVIGVASSERDPGKDAKGKPLPDKRLEGVKEFVKKQGKDMDYRIAFDGKREMTKLWMMPAKQNGIPCAFIVGHDGKISHIGNPLSPDMDEQVNKALAAAKGKETPAKKTALK